MRAVRFLPLVVVLLVMPISSCDDDGTTPAKPKSPYKSLSADQPRDNALFNLQLTCNERNIEHYEELLDEGLIFYFSPWDVLNGTVESWDRAAEAAAATNLFDPEYANPNLEPVKDIDLTLVYEEGDDQWTPYEAPDQVKYTGETWYEKTAYYNLTVQLPGDFQFVGINMKAVFSLRAATVGSEQVWGIVVWRDEPLTNFRDVLGSGQTAGIAKETTWGEIKFLYSE
jgi:hypothetical protein